MTGPVVIDLGEVRRDPPEPTPEPPWSPARRRWLAGLAAAATLAVTLGAGAPLPRPLAEASIPARLGDIAFAEGDRYYVIESGRGRPLASRTITAYALPDARQLWRMPFRVEGAVRGVGAAGGDLLVSTQLDAGELFEAVETVAVAEDTGRELWRRRAHVEGVTPVRGNILLWTSVDGVPAADTGRETLDAVAPSAAEVRWSYRVPAGGWLSYRYADERPTHVVTLLPAGRVEVRDLEDGRVVAAADGLLPPRQPAEPARYVQVAGDLLLVREDRQSITAYGLAGLDLRWRAPVDPSTEYVSSACGRLLCVVSRIRGMRVLDPATGATLWSSDRWSDPRLAGGHLVVNGGDRRTGRDLLVVVDPDTGRQAGELGEWTTLGPAGDGGRLLGVRVDPRTLRAWFAWLDPDRLTVRVVHVADEVTGDCEARAGAVICRRLDASVGVWRLGSP